MTEIVKSATLQAQLDPSGFQQGAQAVTNSAVQMTDAVDKSSKSMQAANSNTRLSAEGFQRWLSSIDPAVRSGNEYAKAMDTLDKYQKAGLVSSNDLMIAQAGIKARFEEAKEPVDHFGASIEKTAGLLDELGLIIGAKEAFNIAREIESNTAALENQAIVIGASVEGYQAMAAAMERSGVDSETASTALRRLGRAAGEALQSSGDARDLFTHLGVTAADLAAGMDVYAPKVFRGLSQIKEGATLAKDEITLFGRSGQILTPAIGELSHSIDTLKEKYADMIVAADEAHKAKDATIELGEAWHRLEVQAAGPLTGATNMLAGLVEKMKEFSDWAHKINGDRPTTFGEAILNYFNGGKTGASADAAPGAMLGGPLASKRNSPAYPTQWSNTNLDEFNAKMQQQLELVGKTKIARAEDTALIEYATAMLKDQGKSHEHIYDVEQAIKVIGDQKTVNQIKLNAAKIEQDQIDEKAADKDKNRLKEHANDFNKYLQQIQQETQFATETAGERAKETDFIKAAQELQKQNGVLETNLVQTYAQAVEYLRQRNDLQKVETAELEKQAAIVRGQLLKPLEDQIEINKLPIDQREYAGILKQNKDKYGQGMTPDNQAKLQSDYDIIQRQRADDDIQRMREQVQLAGEMPLQREKDEAILREIHATHGQITEDQKQQIRNLIDLQHETEDWMDLTVGLEHDFGNFLSNVVATGKFDFKSLSQDVLRDWADLLTKMAERWAEANIFGNAPGGGIGGLFGIGGAMSGPLWGTSASGGQFLSDMSLMSGAPFLGLADGGPVAAGQTIMVGENGPEPFTPMVPGYITPADTSRDAGGDVNITVNVSAPGASPNMLPQIKAMVQQGIAEAAPLLISASTLAVSAKLRNTGRGGL